MHIYAIKYAESVFSGYGKHCFASVSSYLILFDSFIFEKFYNVSDLKVFA